MRVYLSAELLADHIDFCRRGDQETGVFKRETGIIAFVEFDKARQAL